MKFVSCCLLLLLALFIAITNFDFEADAKWQSQDSNFNNAGSSGPWTPAALGANLVGWWDTSKLSSLYQDTGCSTTPVTSNGQNIDCIKDQSGNGNNVGNVGSTQGTYATSGYNSLPSISFTAANNSQLGTGNIAAFEGLSAATACAVVMFNTSPPSINTNFGGAIGANPTSSSNAIAMISLDGSSRIALDYDFGVYNNTFVPTNGVTYDICQVINGTAVTTYVNGVSIGANTFPGLTFSASVAPIYAVFNAPTMYYAESFIANTPISSTVAAEYHAYRVNKWGDNTAVSFAVDATNRTGQWNISTSPNVCPSANCTVSGSTSTNFTVGPLGSNTLVGIAISYTGAASSGLNGSINSVVVNGTISGGNCTGGITATKLVDGYQSGGSNGGTAVWVAPLSSGTSVSVCFRYTGGNGWSGIGIMTVFTLTDTAGAAHYTLGTVINTTPPAYGNYCSGSTCTTSASITVGTNSMGFAVGLNRIGSVKTETWSGTTPSPTDQVDFYDGIGTNSSLATVTGSGTLQMQNSCGCGSGFSGVVVIP